MFLCGGIIKGLADPSSAREFFLSHLQTAAPTIAARTRLAEKVNEWFDEEVFDDLLELEHYLAELSDLTVLFVESAGSIAELGAFAALDSVRHKTLAVINTSHPTRKTFISDGPVKRLKNHKRARVQAFSWATSLPDPVALPALTDMSKKLVRILKRIERTRVLETNFDRNKPAHVLLLIADIVGIAGVATKDDIRNALINLDLASETKNLKRYLSLLESLALVRQVEHGTESYFLNDTTSPYLSYSYLPTAPSRDVARYRRDIRRSLKGNRRRVLHDHLPSFGAIAVV